MNAKSAKNPRADSGARARAQARTLADGHNELKVRRMGIETLHEAHVFLRADSHATAIAISSATPAVVVPPPKNGLAPTRVSARRMSAWKITTRITNSHLSR